MAFNSEMLIFGEKNVEVLYPMHEIDSYNGDEMKTHIRSNMDGSDAVIINCSRVTYLNSSGLRELIQILKNMRELNKPLYLTAVNEEIMKVFKSTNLNRLFNIHENNDDAMRYII
ncbi:MAG: STAS domain-containing protein [Deferribacterales bacterium]